MGQGSQAVNTFYCVCVCMDMTKKSTHEELTSCCCFFFKKKATTKQHQQTVTNSQKNRFIHGTCKISITHLKQNPVEISLLLGLLEQPTWSFSSTFSEISPFSHF